METNTKKTLDESDLANFTGSENWFKHWLGKMLFTDGVNEAVNAKEEDFGEERIAEVARQHRESNAVALHEVITQAVTQHCDGKFDDDATLVVVGAK